MALDHYLARTYLKHWCDKDASRPLRAYRKSDGKEFPCWPRDVCTEPDGDLNQYLTKPDMLGLTDLTTRACGKTARKVATIEQARFVNSLIVKHAGDLVFSSRADADVAALVAELRKYGVQLDHTVMSLEEIKAALSIAKTEIGVVR
jgi:hypothetical protein